MTFFEIFVLAVGLSMDAFAVAICKGLSLKQLKLKHALIVGAYFGGFQALMPLIGYFLGTSFYSFIESFDHWVAFILLALIGGNMIRESFSKEEEECTGCNSFAFKAMLPLALATSIDALASGIAICSISLTKMLICAACIGIITFTLSGVGVFVGNKFGQKYKSRAELVGGIILILLGLKMLLEGLGILG